MNISSTGLSAQRFRMNIIAENLANVESTRTAQGGPYRRKEVLFASADAVNWMTVAEPAPLESGGTFVVGVTEDQTPVRLVYNPGHPDANSEGYVAMPNVNVVMEMVDIISATRAYEANVAAISAAKSMAIKALEIGKV